MTGTKKPSGQQFRVARRQKQQEARERQAHRVQVGDQAPTFAPKPCADLSTIHLRQLERLHEMQEIMLADETVPREERAKLILATTHAMSKINSQAQLERDMEQYRTAIKAREDALIAEQASTLTERHKLQQLRAAAIEECKRLGITLPEVLRSLPQ